MTFLESFRKAEAKAKAKQYMLQLQADYADELTSLSEAPEISMEVI